MTLMGALSFAGLSDAGMIATMPQSPRFREDVFSVPITAHTNPSAGFALSAWSSLLGILAFGAALCWSPSFAELQLGLDDTRLRDVSTVKACRRAFEAIHFNPNYANGHVALATALAAMAQLPEARESARAALSLEPNNARATIQNAGVV